MAINVPNRKVEIKQSSDGVMRNKDEVAVNGEVFAKYASRLAVASEYSYIQLMNPSGSGVVVLLDEIYVYENDGGPFIFGFYNTQLSNDVGVWTTRDETGANGLADIRTQTNVTLLGSIGVTYNIGGDIGVPIQFNYPIPIPEGVGFMVRSAVVNKNLKVTFTGRQI